MRISVIVPFFNEERHIAACVESLLAQDYPEDAYEILMVDNNSTDGSVEIVRRYPRVRLLHESVQGDFASRNRGLAEATGQVVAFTDADTAPFPDWLGNIARTMADPEVGIIIGRLEFASDSPLLAMMEAYEAEKGAYVFSSDIPEIYFGYTCNMAVRRTLFERLGPFASVQRNSDVVFVRRAVDTCSCRVAVYGPEVRVLRLEIPTFGAYLAKQRTYGRDYPRYAESSGSRPLNARQRWQIFRRTVRAKGYSPLRAAILLSLLVMGALSYEAARWRRAWSPRGEGGRGRLESGSG